MLSPQMMHHQLSKSEVGIVGLPILCAMHCCSNLTVSAAGKSPRHGTADPPAEDASSSGSYAAPSMPVESVDMFSGLDLTGFALPAAESAAETVQATPELTQSSAQSLVQHRYLLKLHQVFSPLSNLLNDACPPSCCYLLLHCVTLSRKCV